MQFTTGIFKEGRSYVAHALELDVSSFGSNDAKALGNFRLFLEESERMGTVEMILEGVNAGEFAV
jgi:hypothetical protein